MRWYKHLTDDRNKLESKLIRKQFGAEGYGIYQALLEVIGEYVEADNLKDWGSVHPLHTIETLADECSTTPEKLQEFLKFCNSKGIFEKKDGKLHCQLILSRLDEFASKVVRTQSGLNRDSIGTKSGIEEKRRDKTRIDKKRVEEKRIEYNGQKNKKKFTTSSSPSVEVPF